jgi:hypothetical protein
MKTVLLLGGPAAGQSVEIHGTMRTWNTSDDKRGYFYHVVPMCSHGEVHWFGVLDGADPLALLIAGYGMNVVPKASRMTGLRGGADSATVPTYGDQS